MRQVNRHVAADLCRSRDSTPDGGAGRDRTDDLKLAKLALSQLSYGPLGGCPSIAGRELRSLGFRRTSGAARWA